MDVNETDLSEWYESRKQKRIDDWQERAEEGSAAGEEYWDMYRFGETSFVAKLRTKASQSRAGNLGKYGGFVTKLEDLLDAIYATACGYIYNLDFPAAYGLAQRESDPSLGMSAFHKGMLGLFSALELTLAGQHGSARPILRQVFEWALLAKFYLVFSDLKLLRRWIEGSPIALRRHVIEKLPVNARKELGSFWTYLCQLTHASTAAQQMFVGAAVDIREVRANLNFVRMLAECVYHLLNSWMIPRSYREFVWRCLSDKEVEEAMGQRLRVRELLAVTRTQLPRKARSVVYAFRRDWSKG